MDKTTDYKKGIATLYRINRFLEYIENLERLLYLIMQEASHTVQAEASSIALYDQRKKKLIFTVALGKKGAKIKQMRMKLGRGIIGYVAQTKKPLNIPDVAKDKRFYSGIDKKTEFKTKSILAVPIIHKQKLIGALEVINKKGAPSFSSRDMKLLEIVAGQAAIAIENAKLYQQLAKKHQALQKKHKQLIETQQKLIFMERLSAIGDMASRMVHDLRNPLAIIRNCAQLLKLPEFDAQEKEKLPQIIVDEIDRLTGMTTEVMDYVRGKTTLVFGEYPLGDFINEVSNFLKRDFQDKNIQLVTKTNYTGPISMDRFKIQRAVFNLAFNARDAMPNGGIFQIETNLINNEEVEIRLSDTGSGIPKEIKDKLFKPFVTHGKAHGTGLGLAIVKKIIVENHNGSISVESQPPKEGSFSTTFSIRIPLKRKT